jgi:diacylglycerol kinase
MLPASLLSSLLLSSKRSRRGRNARDWWQAAEHSTTGIEEFLEKEQQEEQDATVFSRLMVLHINVEYQCEHQLCPAQPTSS